MLRHIVSVGLAMTACAALIPTKVNAVTLTIDSTPSGISREITAKPGDLITFTYKVVLDNTTDNIVPKILFSDFDKTELSPFAALEWLVPVGRPIAYIPGNFPTSTTTVSIATLRLKVDKPVKDTRPDVWGTLTFDEEYKTVNGEIRTLTDLKLPGNGSDVVPQQPVPEPLTMLGAAAALGYGAILKRKYSKNTEF
jgi:hypothetical protein